MPNVTINGQAVSAAEGQSILEAARTAGITIPTLCFHPDLSVSGSCRLCLVEVEGHQGLVPACSQPAHEGMVIHTETSSVIASRRFVLELLLRRYVDRGDAAGDREQTEFLHWVKHYGARMPEEAPVPRHAVNSDANPFLWVDMNKCILCTRCVRACREIQDRFVWGVAGRGTDATIVAGVGTSLLDARCESCGACAAYCPTGALDDKMSIGLGRPDKVVPTTCTYCGVGCTLELNVKNGRIIRVTSNPEAPVNGMSLCVKGRYGYDFVHHPERLTKPQMRRYLLDGGPKRRASDSAREWVEVDWDKALNLVAGKLVDIKRESGPDAVGILASAKCTNEENYLMQKFARQVMGTHNVDHCARLCHGSTVAGLAMAFGSGAMSNSMDDIAADSKAIFLIGSNVTEQHPVFGTMVRRAVLTRRVRLVVADPRKIDITEFADLHLRHNPGTDVALINGIMRIILQSAGQNQTFIDERCEGFEDFRETVAKYTPEKVSAITGVPVVDLETAAEILARSKPLAVIWAMGITQHTCGVLNVLSLANLQMLLGNMGVPGGGVNPLRGQNNVQGACDMGALPNVFPGYQPVTDPGVAAKYDSFWALDSKVALPAPLPPEGNAVRTKGTSTLGLPGKPGLTVLEMIDAAGSGRLRALYLLGEDPVLTDPDSNHVRKCLEAAEFIVLQEIFPSESSVYADVLLPGVSFAEKSGTFTNTERRVQLVRQALEPRGEARPDWAITTELARRVLTVEGRRPIGPQASWDYDRPAQIMDEIAAVTPSYAGINHSRLQHGERLQWPVPHADHPGTPILHIGTFTRGKGKFHAVDHLPPAELPDADYPLVLTTGRVLYHWHGGEITRRSKGLMEACPQSLVEISPDDAAKLGLSQNAKVRVRSRRGEMVGRTIITDRVSPGVVFGNFHFPGRENINQVTIAAVDPIARIPEYKVCAVAVEPVQDESSVYV
jgi:formate dehydrogenase alpha subunit